MTLHGAGKTPEEHEAALEGRVGRIVIDGMDELHAFVARVNGRSADVLLRFNTGIEAHTHDFIRTAGNRSKFGFAPSEADEAFALLRERAIATHAWRSRAYRLANLRRDAIRRERAALDGTAARMRAAGFAAADIIIIGGGFGVQMRPDAKDETIDIAGTLDAVARVVPSDIQVEIEPGRALIAAAGTSLYRVMAVKRFEGRRFVIVDGSMADNPRPALYGAYHHFEAVEPRTPLAPAMVCGRSCEATNSAKPCCPEDLRAGDLVVMRTTGAYTYSMSSNYNRFPRPPVIAVDGDQLQIWASRGA